MLTDKNADGVYSLKWKAPVPKNIFNLKNGDLREER